MKVIDLFAGCGGLSLGFVKAGYTITKAVEFDPVIAETYKMNHSAVDVIVDDIKNIDINGVFSKKDADVIIGGPPCQGFPMAGARIRQGFIDDPRNYLFKHYFNVVKAVRPDVFLMENVKGLLTLQGGKIFEEIEAVFSDPNMFDGKPYYIYHRIIRATDFGIPQKRERVIIIGSTKQFSESEFDHLWAMAHKQVLEESPTFFDEVTVEDAIGNLPTVSCDGFVANPTPLSPYQSYLSCGEEKLQNHIKSNHSAKAVARMKQVKNGENFTVLDEKIKSVHSGSYGRLCWDEPASTITTRFDTPAGGRFIHPSEDRTLSPREAARIQSFPDSFVFYGDRRSVSRQIGNAVPPKVSYFLAKLVKNIIAASK